MNNKKNENGLRRSKISEICYSEFLNRKQMSQLSWWVKTDNTVEDSLQGLLNFLIQSKTGSERCAQAYKGIFITGNA